jgi:hypothetical protein
LPLTNRTFLTAIFCYLTRSGTERRETVLQNLLKMTKEFPMQYYPLLDDVVVYLDDVTLASFYSRNMTLTRHPTIFSIADARSPTGCRISKLKDSRDGRCVVIKCAQHASIIVGDTRRRRVGHIFNCRLYPTVAVKRLKKKYRGRLVVFGTEKRRAPLPIFHECRKR